MADKREEEVLKIQSFRTEFPKGTEVITEKRDVSHQKGCLLYEQEIYYKMVN